MNDYERKGIELEQIGLAEEKFEKPMDCANKDQNRLVYAEFKNSYR
jgi:hypothetical protein